MAEATAVERWAPIPERDGYEVSDLGRVRSVDRVIVRRNGARLMLRGQLLRPAVNDGGYLYVDFGRYRTSPLVHCLVLETFVGPRPPGMETRHLNSDPTDNRLANLEWSTHQDNVSDMVTLGHHNFGARKRCPRGHRLVPPNIPRTVLARGHRRCLACLRTHSSINSLRRRGRPVPDFQAEADRRYLEIMRGVTAR